MITPAKAFVRAWLASWWPRYARAVALAQDYAAVKDERPLMMADLARFCCAFDSTFAQGDPDTTLVNQGKREVFLHIQAMAGLTEADLAHLRERTEEDV